MNQVESIKLFEACKDLVRRAELLGTNLNGSVKQIREIIDEIEQRERDKFIK